MVQVQTRYLNPNNLSLDADGYFTNPEVLQRVPSVFLLLGKKKYYIEEAVLRIRMQNPVPFFYPLDPRSRSGMNFFRIPPLGF
jgi:hypothetical protein